MRGDGRREQDSCEGGDRDRFVTLGRVSGVYGVRGWLRVHSETRRREGILGYTPWCLALDGDRLTFAVEDGRTHGKGLVVKLAGCDDRDAAAALVGADIQVRRSQLADDLEPGEYYWADLEGLAVETLDGVALGYVDHLFETGANDVLVVRGERERLIPYLPGQVVREVDLVAGRMRVDWDPAF